MGLFLRVLASAVTATAASSSIPIVKAEQPAEIFYDEPSSEKVEVLPSAQETPIASPSSATAPVVIRKPPSELEDVVRSGRLWLQSASSFVTVHVDVLMNKYLAAESSVTSTIASLKSESEPLLPGTIYVLVSTMAASIATRRRMAPIRSFLAPAVAGTAAMAYFLPQTFANVRALAWKYESSAAPAVAKQHVAVAESVSDVFASTKASTENAKATVLDTVKKTRKAFKDATGLKIDEDK
ncbi:apolipo protein O-domain-containing protein [Dipodascopsis uninucleata]